MKVLVTGGTGVVNDGVLRALLAGGHTVRLLSPVAERLAAEWPQGMEPRIGDVSRRSDVRGAAEGCSAVIHLAGAAGARFVVDEAGRAGVTRIVLISTLGAPGGTSEHHDDARRAESAVRSFSAEWVVLRPALVYGPGDESVSLLLKMVRLLPALPVFGADGPRLQPLWYEDLGAAVAAAVDLSGLAGRTLEIAGPEQVTLDSLIERLSLLTGRAPIRIPVPSVLAGLGAQAAALTGLRLSLLEGDQTIAASGENALASVLGIEPTRLDAGLEKLLSELPEQKPREGVGALRHERFWADIERPHYRAREMRDVLKRSFREIVGTDDGAGDAVAVRVRKGTTFTLPLPLRGPISLRIAEVVPDRITAATLDGHPLAGVVSFRFVERGEEVRFMVDIHARAASTMDQAVLLLLEGLIHDAHWRGVVQRMVEAAGGEAPLGVQHESRRLDLHEARDVEAWVQALVTGAKRQAQASAARGRAPRRARATRPAPATRPSARSPRLPRAQ